MEEPPPFHTSWDWKISPLSTRLCDFSSLRAVVALQKANGSWDLTSALTSALGLSKAEVKGQRPSKVSRSGAGGGKYHELNFYLLQVSSLSWTSRRRSEQSGYWGCLLVERRDVINTGIWELSGTEDFRSSESLCVCIEVLLSGKDLSKRLCYFRFGLSFPPDCSIFLHSMWSRLPGPQCWP